LNLSFCVIEAVGGYYASSQAVMADALHDLGDSLSLLVLLGLRWMAGRAAGEAFSFGYRRLNVIGAGLVGGGLILGSVVILGQSVPKLTHPEPVHSVLMLALAFLGVVVNGIAFLRLRAHMGVGEKMVSLHLLEDLWGWVIVFIGALAIHFYSWYWLDPLLSVFLAFFILWRTLVQMKQLGRLFLLGASSDFGVAKVTVIMMSVDGVVGVHHVHVWELDAGFHVVTGHVVIKQDAKVVVIKQQIRERLTQLGSCEVTLEIEQEGEVCLDPVHPSTT
jgi:cobalt-zinc-cadmium efflux system protein